MQTRYSHLSTKDRHVIEVFLRLGASAASVASFLGRHRSTVCREIARARAFKGSSVYVAHFGQLHAQRARRLAGLARRKLGADLNSPAWLHVRQGLAAGLSPQIIAGRLARSCRPTGSHLLHPAFVSHETIYCAIYAMPRGTLRSELISQLARSRSGRRPRRKATSRSTRVPEMTPISLRPPEVAARIVPGHWEGDLIKGAGGKSAIGTLVERTSRYIMLVRLDGLSAHHILDGFTRRLRSIPPELRRTLTYDQGSEMALHKTLAQRLRMDIFFCDAYKPWQRGSNENANGLIRRYLPKGIDLSPFTDQDLSKLEFILNNRLRQILDYATPNEVFSQLKLDAIAGVALQA
jgi:transposase, IS30 family